MNQAGDHTNRERQTMEAQTSKRYTVVRLVADAARAGLEITNTPGGTQIKGNGIKVMIREDNSIARHDVRLELTKRMTARETARALGLAA